jgi:hypothetical protein
LWEVLFPLMARLQKLSDEAPVEEAEPDNVMVHHRFALQKAVGGWGFFCVLVLK